MREAETPVYNFSAGPGVLFKDVLEQVQNEMRSWNGKGFSILETSHRMPEFSKLIMGTKHKMRMLLNVPCTHDILFVQGGATQMFSTIPLNFSRQRDTVDYIVNGYWSRYAAKEANKYSPVNIVGLDRDGVSCPQQSELKLSPKAAYVHYCSNETIDGCEFQYVPETEGVPLICDMSSNFLSKPIDVSKYGMIYAGSHKNVGPSGLVIVIVRLDMLGKARSFTPTMMNLTEISLKTSMLNTPPVFPIYFCDLTIRKLLSMGGLSEIEKINQSKAKMVYDAIDGSDGFYQTTVFGKHRSNMNIPFYLRDDLIEKSFLEQANANGLVGLEGHPLVGKCRASLYNAMSVEGVRTLVEFMLWFKDQPQTHYERDYGIDHPESCCGARQSFMEPKEPTVY